MIHWALAGLWAEVWHWGLGIGVVILLLAAAYFSPVGKKYLVIAAVVVVLLLLAYARGIHDQSNRCVAQQKVVTEQVTAAVKTAHTKKALHARDPYNSRHY
jgi:hypothetical protein